MRKQTLLLLLLLPLLLQAQEIEHIGQLFDLLKTQPITAGDQIRVNQARAGKSMAYSKLYPTIDAFGRYDYASVPSGMLPVPPNDLIKMVQDKTVAQPFSENIYRLGATFSMPIFVSSIFSMVNKANKMLNSTKELQYINLLKNEALIVGANANLLYIQSLGEALDKKRASLEKTREFVNLKVKNGRAPESALLNLNSGIDQIDVTKNELALQRDEVIALIQSVTGIVLAKPLQMGENGTYTSGEIVALNPLREKVKADKAGYSAEWGKLLPSVFVQGNYSHNYANSYNNNQALQNDYTAIGVMVKVPIFEKDQYAQIRKSKWDYEATKNEFDKMKLELSAQATQLEKSLVLLDSSIQLYTNSIKNKTQLLEIAKVSYQTERMSMEDYLKYEDDLVLEETKLYKSQAQKWQTLMKLNVIYGNNIEEIVK